MDANRLLISFSAYTNGARLFDVTKNKVASSLNCLHGLRAMSIFWIMLGHRFYNQFPWGNANDFSQFQRGLLSSVVKAHPIAVDTFFLMGALLMTHTTLRDCDEGSLNIPRMIWRRYLRYTPVYMAVILTVICFSKYLLTGPYVVDALRDACVDNWWMAMLHIQNYLPSGEMCLNHGWYLSADFQLFIVSPFIVCAIHKFGTKLLAVPAALCITTIIYIIAISFAFDIHMPSPTASGDYLKWIYYPTQSRAGPWFIGIVLGHFLYAHRGRTIKISALTNALMWILSLSTLCTVVLLQHAFSITADTSTGANAFFMALQRNLWACALCWIIFACQHLKTGGIVRWFLSLPQWQPISRMGLSMYIIGAVYQVLMILNQRVPLHLNAWHVVRNLFSFNQALTTIDRALLLTVSHLLQRHRGRDDFSDNFLSRI
jgi:peptidoglycan/LPS O-acetylase OafA/YrhL